MRRPSHRADRQQRNLGSSAYHSRAVRAEAIWGHLDGYEPRHLFKDDEEGEARPWQITPSPPEKSAPTR